MASEDFLYKTGSCDQDCDTDRVFHMKWSIEEVSDAMKTRCASEICGKENGAENLGIGNQEVN